MRTHAIIVCLALSLGIAGCSRDPVDPSADVDIRGLTDQQAAEVVSDSMCTKMAQCPAEECECSATPDSPAVCTCQIVYSDEAECAEDMYDEILDDFQSANLSDEDKQLVNDCVNAYKDTPCLTEAQVQANIDAIQADEDPPYEHEIPVECEQMMELFSQETTPVDDETDTPQPGR